MSKFISRVAGLCLLLGLSDGLAAADLAQEVAAYSPPPPHEGLYAAETKPVDVKVAGLGIQGLVLLHTAERRRGLVFVDRGDTFVDAQATVLLQSAEAQVSMFGPIAERLRVYLRGGTDLSAQEQSVADVALGGVLNVSSVLPIGLWGEVGYSEERGTHGMADANLCIFHGSYTFDADVKTLRYGLRYRWAGGPYGLSGDVRPLGFECHLDYATSTFNDLDKEDVQGYVMGASVQWRPWSHVLIGASGDWSPKSVELRPASSSEEHLVTFGLALGIDY